MLPVIEHPLDGIEAEGFGLVVVVEDQVVHPAGFGVLGGVLVLDVAEFQERVRVAGRLDQPVRMLVVEVLRRSVGALHQLRAREQTTPQDLVHDLSRVMASRVKKDDRSVRRLPVQPRRVDASAHALGRLAKGLECSDLCVDLLLEGDNHRPGVVNPEIRGLLYRVLLERPVQRQQQVVTGIDQLPLVGVGDRDTPALVQGLDALEGRSTKVVHDHEHRACRPVIPDVVAAETVVDEGRPLRSDDVPASPAPPLFVMVLLSAEQRLADDADDDLLPVSAHLGESAHRAHRTDHADLQRMEDLLRCPIGARTVAAVTLGTGRVAAGLLAVVAPCALGARLGLTAARRVRIGRRCAGVVHDSGFARRAGLATGLLRFGRRGEGRSGRDLVDHAVLPLLGPYDLLGHKGAEQGPVGGLELLAVHPVTQLSEPAERDLEPSRRRADL